MRATLDSTIEFDQRRLKIGSWRQESIERSAAGLDGVVSLSLGSRSRELVQHGLLRAVSDADLTEKIDAVAELLDGQSHTLVTADGQQYADLRVDVFEPGEKKYSGRGPCCEFEIGYTQLAQAQD